MRENKVLVFENIFQIHISFFKSIAFDHKSHRFINIILSPIHTTQNSRNLHVFAANIQNVIDRKELERLRPRWSSGGGRLRFAKIVGCYLPIYKRLVVNTFKQPCGLYRLVHHGLVMPYGSRSMDLLLFTGELQPRQNDIDFKDGFEIYF